MNTAEHLSYSTDDRISDTHGSLIAALQTAKRTRFMQPDQTELGAYSARRCSAVRLPVIHVPRLSWWQCTRLSRLGFPDPKQMVAEMTEMSRTADEAVAHALEQVLQSSFAPEIRNAIEMYLAYEGTPEIYDPMRVFQAYALYSYATGVEDEARRINKVVPMTEDMKALRARIAMS